MTQLRGAVARGTLLLVLYICGVWCQVAWCTAAAGLSRQLLVEGQELSTEICARINAVQICSQRASALEFALEESTLDSFRALWDAGIVCYDMDFVGTKDRQLVAASPKRFRWTIEELEPAEIPWPSMQYTIRQLREFGASIFQLPTLDQFLRDLRRRLIAANLHDTVFEESDIRRPWVFVRLKEPSFQQELLRQVVATANRHRALQFLVLVFESAEEVEAVHDMGLWQGKIMRAFPGPNATGVAESLEPYNMLGAELHLQEEALRRLQEANKPMFASSVEDEQAMLQALRQGFTGVSTASPMQLQQALHAWRAECQAREINPSILPNTA